VPCATNLSAHEICERDACVVLRTADVFHERQQYRDCIVQMARMINKPGPIDVAAINVELNKVLRLSGS
jgi:hypothetical protein